MVKKCPFGGKITHMPVRKSGFQGLGSLQKVLMGKIYHFHWADKGKVVKMFTTGVFLSDFFTMSIYFVLHFLWQVCLFGWNRVGNLLPLLWFPFEADRMWKEGKDSASKEEIFTSQTELYPVKAPIHQNIYNHFVLFSYFEKF